MIMARFLPLQIASVFGLLCILQRCVCWVQTNDQRPMLQYKYNGPKWWDTVPTWHLELQVPPGYTPTPDSMFKLAYACYNWVERQDYARGDGNDVNAKAIVIAAMFNPSSRLIHVSTVPRGARAWSMVSLQPKMPAWGPLVSSWIDQKKPPLCAEDGSVFNAESMTGANIQNGRYPAGTYMVVFGSWEIGDPPGPVGPCDNKRSDPNLPGCKAMLDSLGITYKSQDWPAGDWEFDSPGGDEGEPWNTADEKQMMEDLDPGFLTNNMGRKRNTDELSSTSPEPSLALRDATSVPAMSYTPFTWRTYSGPLTFPTTPSNIEVVDTAWLEATTDSSQPSATATSPSTISSQTPSCTFQGAEPGQGVDQGACTCVLSGITTVLPQLTVVPSASATGPDDAYCYYSSLPSTTLPNPATTDVTTYTRNCQACTLVGGIADIPTCTSVPSCTTTPPPQPTQAIPTFAVWVADRKLDVGDAEGTDNGTALAQDMLKQLSGFCSGTSCDVSQYAKMTDIETVVKGGEEPLRPQMYFENAVYTDQATLKQMIAAGLSTWMQATLKLCEEVEYKADADETISGCGHGPIPVSRRNNVTLMVEPHSVVEKRCGDGASCFTDTECTYTAKICSAPDLITVVKSDGKGNPYANEISIGINYGKPDAFDVLLCESIVNDLTDLAIAFFPELLPEEEVGELGFDAFCGAVGDLVNSGS